MTAPAGDEPRWAGLSHQEIQRMVADGPGGQGSTAAEQAWRGTADALAALRESIGSRAGSLPAGWEGEAADGARNGLSGLAWWTGSAADGARRTADGLGAQAGLAAELRTRMPPPAEVGPPDVAPSGTALMADWADADVTATNGAQRAAELMQRYGDDSRVVAASFAGSPAPPAVTAVSGPHAPAGSERRWGHRPGRPDARHRRVRVEPAGRCRRCRRVAGGHADRRGGPYPRDRLRHPGVDRAAPARRGRGRNRVPGRRRRSPARRHSRSDRRHSARRWGRCRIGRGRCSGSAHVRRRAPPAVRPAPDERAAWPVRGRDRRAAATGEGRRGRHHPVRRVERHRRDGSGHYDGVHRRWNGRHVHDVGRRRSGVRVRCGVRVPCGVRVRCRSRNRYRRRHRVRAELRHRQWPWIRRRVQHRCRIRLEFDVRLRHGIGYGDRPRAGCRRRDGIPGRTPR